MNMTNENKSDINAFAARLKVLRETLGLNQTNMAKEMGYTNSFISELEKGKGKPGYEFLGKLNSLYRVNLGWLIHGDGGMILNHNEKRNPNPQITLNNSEKDVAAFYWYFQNSPMFKHTIMGFALKFLHDNQLIIKRDIEIYQAELLPKEELNENERWGIYQNTEDPL